MEIKDCCINCRFGRPEQNMIQCQRFPPQVTLSVDRQLTYSNFPMMNPLLGWCGEHERKLESVK